MKWNCDIYIFKQFYSNSRGNTSTAKIRHQLLARKYSIIVTRSACTKNEKVSLTGVHPCKLFLYRIKWKYIHLLEAGELSGNIYLSSLLPFSSQQPPFILINERLRLLHSERELATRTQICLSTLSSMWIL